MFSGKLSECEKEGKKFPNGCFIHKKSKKYVSRITSYVQSFLNTVKPPFSEQFSPQVFDYLIGFFSILQVTT